MSSNEPTHPGSEAQPPPEPGREPELRPAPEPGYAVDVVIAVHTPTRPIARAIKSVLDQAWPGLRLTVVCHNIAADQIQAACPPELVRQVRWLEHHDGKHRPAGPFNAGIGAAEAEFVSIMGSDDVLAPGAVSSWYRLAKTSGADAVIARLERAGKAVPTPPTRPGRTRNLDVVRDRLCYRSAPLGLVSSAAIARLGLRLDENVAVGDDVGFVTKLFSQESIAFDRRGPAYVIGEDATDRVTLQDRPIGAELAFLPTITASTWFASLPVATRRAAVVKYLRIHLFGAIYYRRDPNWWTPTEREALANIATTLLAAAPGAETVLSLADRDVLDAALDAAVPAEALIARAEARRRHGRPRTLITRDLTRIFAREAPLRMMAASALVR